MLPVHFLWMCVFFSTVLGMFYPPAERGGDNIFINGAQGCKPLALLLYYGHT